VCAVAPTLHDAEMPPLGAKRDRSVEKNIKGVPQHRHPARLLRGPSFTPAIDRSLICRRPLTISTSSSISAPAVNCSIAYAPKATTTKREDPPCSRPFSYSRSNPTSSDAAALVRSIFKAVTYIHDADIVHRGAPPLPFRFLL
jgi:hypothetical protein